MKKLLTYCMVVTLLIGTLVSNVSASTPLVKNTNNTKEIVKTNCTYTYELLTSNIKQLASTYPGLISYQSIGKSEFNREIWAVKLGKGKSNVFFNGSHHAREWMTSIVLMKMIEDYAKYYKKNIPYSGYPVKTLLDQTTIWFVPMVNPDGVTLQQKGVNAFPKKYHSSLIKMNAGSKNFKRWKSNIKGTDINRNYPANWKTIKDTLRYPSYQKYKGKTPLDTKEAKALVNFTYKIKPEISVSYHSSGQTLYWYYYTKPKFVNRDKAIANKISKITGYKLMPLKDQKDGGGYKDWFISTFNRPSFTVEISPAVGPTHVPLAYFPSIWKKNKTIGLMIAEEGHKLWKKKK